MFLLPSKRAVKIGPVQGGCFTYGKCMEACLIAGLLRCVSIGGAAHLAEPLLGELLFLELEDESVELLLKSLVRVVDEELLEGVGAESLEPEDV